MKKTILILLILLIFLLIGCESKKFNVPINQVMADFGVNENGDTRFTIVIHSLDFLKIIFEFLMFLFSSLMIY